VASGSATHTPGEGVTGKCSVLFLSLLPTALECIMVENTVFFSLEIDKTDRLTAEHKIYFATKIF
jgi:hypothetical protein